MILSKEVQDVLDFIQKIEIDENLNPWEANRAFYEKFIPLAGEKEAVFQITEQTLSNAGNSINLRIYRPNNNDKQPVIIYFHGGWFNAGSLETHDTPLRQLSNATQSTIISVDYRLAPEYPFPAGLHDCEFAVKWLIENALSLNINPEKIIIAGDSAGGALASSITRKFRSKIAVQLLIYPVTNNDLKTASWIEFQNGPLLDLKGGIQAWDWYLSKQHEDNPDAVPLLANDLSGLPPTFIAVAEYDPLRDEAIQYSKKIKKAEGSVKLNLYKGTTHGFFQMGGFIDESKILIQDIVDFLNNTVLIK
ncbi:alpha/beta hydrolase [Flavobacterium quisquiliarum]|uniref:Alpha/beta hydrolase n=1 Tax=Flavobacterium quisquiliarum TaxID=1834436 RepID=A0ABV8W203_9FLAO|nr:alpha/beta hydrolase [Flavobacterium quisquiliarum]MBW1655419.1 alpha/beta hydrolase fold domain-containing protein [Flavobacterium quisquiliarum]NWL03043.1 alpha/beta hydrolase [Flavobacterium collinsii]